MRLPRTPTAVLEFLVAASEGMRIAVAATQAAPFEGRKRTRQVARRDLGVQLPKAGGQSWNLAGKAPQLEEETLLGR